MKVPPVNGLCVILWLSLTCRRRCGWCRRRGWGRRCRDGDTNGERRNVRVWRGKPSYASHV